MKVGIVLEKLALTAHAPRILQPTWREIAIAPAAASQGIGIAVRKAMTSTIEWLRTKAPGFAHLSKNEQDAIAHFSFMWSLFESRALNTEGNVKNICGAIQSWHESGTLNSDVFNPELAYFRQRYYVNGAFTYHFDHLHFRKADREDLVRTVINGSDNDPRNRMATILIIIFRYRNNLFHGIKWQYQLEGQLTNFTTANAILMKVLEQNGSVA